MKLLLAIGFLSFLAVPALAQTNDDIESDTEFVQRQKTKTNQDGSQETEIRSGKVRPARQGDAKVGELYNEDVQRVVKRVEPLNLTSVGIGPVVAGNLGNDAVFYGLALGHHYEVSPWAEIRLSIATAQAPEGRGSYTNLGIGASWFSSIEDYSLIFGGEFGLGTVTGVGRDLTSGFQAGVHGGIRLFRTARAQLGVELFAKTVFTKEDKPIVGGAMISAYF